MDASVVEPVDVVERGPLNVLNVAPRSVTTGTTSSVRKRSPPAAQSQLKAGRLKAKPRPRLAG